jgi:hypothetical protein
MITFFKHSSSAEDLSLATAEFGRCNFDHRAQDSATRDS